MLLQAGMDAPQFELPDADMEMFSLEVPCGKKYGFNSEARNDTLRHFLLANPANRLHLLAHDARPIVQHCPRLMLLLRQFGHSMHIYQTPPHLQHLSEPFAVADDSHYVRRFHFDDPRGILAQHDVEGARVLKSRFTEMWASSHPALSATTLGL